MKDIEWLKETLEERIDTMAKFEEVSYSIGLKEAYQHTLLLINQLDEPEVLSQEWISEHMYYVDDRDSSMVYVSDLQEQLVPKQELPVIPAFVVEWIEDLKSSEVNLLDNIYDYTHDEGIYNYIRANGNSLMRAWLDGYEVEQEPKFHAKVKGWGINGNDGKAFYNGSFPQTLSRRAESVPHTLEEWRDLGIYEDNADFLKVEELEE